MFRRASPLLEVSRLVGADLRWWVGGRRVTGPLGLIGRRGPLHMQKRRSTNDCDSYTVLLVVLVRTEFRSGGWWGTSATELLQ